MHKYRVHPSVLVGVILLNGLLTSACTSLNNPPPSTPIVQVVQITVVVEATAVAAASPIVPPTEAIGSPIVASPTIIPPTATALPTEPPTFTPIPSFTPPPPTIPPTRTSTPISVTPTTIIQDERPVVDVTYKPPLIPVEIVINSRGEIGIRASASVITPIGEFSLGVGQNVASVRDGIGGLPGKNLLLVRVDGDLYIYQLEEGKQFEVTFVSDEAPYRKVGLEYQANGDIVLELESVQSTGATTPTPTPVQSVCVTAPTGEFETIWRSYQAVLGCPVSKQVTIPVLAEEAFEGGHLFWRSDTDDVYVIYDRQRENGQELSEGRWLTDPAWNWREAGEPDPDGIGLTPPTGRMEPKRGFGWLWRTYLGRENGPLGWALDREYGFDNVAQIQAFDKGMIFRGSAPKIYILFYNGRFLTP